MTMSCKGLSKSKDLFTPREREKDKKKQTKKIKEQDCIPVGCVPPACWPSPRMHCSGGGGAGGVCSWGCLLPGGECLLPGEVSAPGGVSAPRGRLLSQHALRQTPPVDRQTRVKTPSQTFFAGGNKWQTSKQILAFAGIEHGLTATFCLGYICSSRIVDRIGFYIIAISTPS